MNIDYEKFVKFCDEQLEDLIQKEKIIFQKIENRDFRDYDDPLVSEANRELLEIIKQKRKVSEAKSIFESYMKSR